jgi:hypothetical protein
MLDFTTASGAERKRAYDAIARELGDDQFFTSKELDTLPKILAPMEQVLSFSSGIMDGNTWLIVLTDSRVLFVDKGMIFGLKQTSIDLENIVTIDGETGLIMGTIRVSTAAGPREIRNVWKRTVNPFINKVRAAQSSRRRGEQLQSPGTDARSDPTPGPAPVSDPVPPPTQPDPVPLDMRPAYTPTPSPATPPAPAPAQPSGQREAAIARLDRLLAAGAINDDEHRTRMRDVR